MNKLDAESRNIAKAKLQKQLEQTIGSSASGLTYGDLQECWENALGYWNIKREEGQGNVQHCGN